MKKFFTILTVVLSIVMVLFWVIKETNMKKIGIIVAMDKELNLFAADLQDKRETIYHKRRFIEGTLLGKKVIVVVSGIGKVNAALCAADLINRFHADIIINIGISGGLDSNLQIGDFVVGDDIVYHDFDTGAETAQDIPERFYSDSELVKLLPDLKHGMICSGDQFIAVYNELMKIKDKLPEALAVDMESAAIAHTCYLYGIPMMSIRQISDTPGVEHHTEQYNKFWANASQHAVQILHNLLEKL